MNRLLACAVIAGAVSSTFLARSVFAMPQDTRPDQKLDVLFLGGTGFLGPPVVERLLEHGHTVTLFNRGNRNDMYGDDVEVIVGNRIVDVEPGLEPLREAIEAGRRWDVVIDTASVHTWTEHSAELLAGAADHYLYVSSLSVYDDPAGEQTEGDQVAEMPDDVADGITRLPYDMTYYGAVKARSEAAAEEHFPGRATVVRPGLIVGPRDFTHRFTYWPYRVREGGEVMAPGNPDDPVMFIDVRDLADFMVVVIEEKHYGIYNTNGPVTRDMTIGELVDACKRATGSDATFTWVDADFLAEREIGGWVQMPVWLPPVGDYAGFHQTSVERARKAGLKSRDLDDTITATLAWLDEWLPEAKESRDFEYKPGENAPGVTRAQETEVLAEWHAAQEEATTQPAGGE